MLSRGRRRELVTLTEVTDPALAAREVPGDVPMFIKIGLVQGPDADEFTAAASQATVFEIRAEPPAQ